jgi:hypothetical protein
LKIIKLVQVLLLSILVLCSSCITIHLPHGFNSGYKQLSAKQKERIVILSNNDSLIPLKDSFTYAITALHLSKLIKANKKSLVYFWTPRCSGSACISILAFTRYCKDYGFTPIVISEYFDYEMLHIQAVNPSSIYAINYWSYGSNYCNTYLAKFQEELWSYFQMPYNKNAPNKFLYSDGRYLTFQKPIDVPKYPWQ